MGFENGDGMDGGFLRNQFWGGGRFNFEICRGFVCCQTGNLNTDDDNWEVGEVNFFVGHQIGNCENFELDSRNLNLTVKHNGNDGGKIKFVDLWTSYRDLGLKFRCFVNKKLDGTESFQVKCERREASSQLQNSCNGHLRFCRIPFNQFMFAGAHNAGTGMMSMLFLDCWLKNHDLSLTEMLDFGLRFFDFDTKL